MSYETKSLKRTSGSIVGPQSYNPDIDDFSPVTVTDLGAGHFGEDNLMWGKTAGGIYVPAQFAADGSILTQLTGSYDRLSTEPKPTAADGVKDGNTLMFVDTGQVFKYYKGQWYAL